MTSNGAHDLIESEDPTALEKLINDEKIFFAGYTLS